MKPLSRHPVNKRHSAAKFRKSTERTKAPNLPIQPMRGGWRL